MIVDLPVFFDPLPDRGGLRVRPLLAEGPQATGRTAEQATARLLQALRELEDDALLALLADPDELTVHVVPLSVRGTSLGAVTVAMFRRGQHHWAVVPRLGPDMFVLPSPTSARGKPSVEALPTSVWIPLVEQEISRVLRRREKDGEGEPRQTPAQLSRVRQEQVVMVDAYAGRHRTPFVLRPKGLSDLLLADAPEELDGAVEIHKVATDLSTLWPDRLLDTTVPDSRVDDLDMVMFGPGEHGGTVRAPVVLVGPAGAGRTTLVHAALHRRLAARSQRRHDVAALVKVWALDPTRVIAGMSVVGAWERRLEAILSYVLNRRSRLQQGLRGPDVLYVDNPVALARVGRSAGSDLTLARVMRPWLESGSPRQLPMVMRATPEEWQRLGELDRAFAALFTVVRVDPPPRSRAMEMVLRALDRLETRYGVTLSAPALARVVMLEARQPGGRVLPGGVVDRLEQVAQWARRQPAPESSTSDGPRIVEEADVDNVFRRATGLRAELIDPHQPLPDAELRRRLASRLIGQPEAIDALASLVHQLKAGLTRPGHPLGTLLLVGPTGTGKTEAAKVLADVLFERADALVRLDMNELTDAGAVLRLVGTPGRDGLLTERLRLRPFAVLLLDEIEKAHPSVHDLLLQVLDEGRLTDGEGRRLDLTGTAILMTSNLGAGEGRGRGFAGPSTNATASSYRSAIHAAFRPEFVNRIDRIVPFGPLDAAAIREVAHLQLQRLLRREGFVRRTVLLDVSAEALDTLARQGFDPTLGARALKRALERGLVGPAAAVVAEHPPEVPLRVSVSAPEGADLAEGAAGAPMPIRVEALSFETARVIPPIPHDPGPLRAQVAALRATLQAGAGPVQLRADRDGLVVAEADRLRLQEVLRELAELLGDDEDDPPAPKYQARVSPLPLSWKSPSRTHRWSCRFDWREAHSRSSIREYLQEIVRATPQTVSSLEQAAARIGWAHRQAARLGAQDRAVVSLTGMGDAAAPIAEVWEPVLRAWLEGLDLSVRVEGRSDRADGLARRSVWIVEGPAAGEILAAELGIHVFYPANGLPGALRLELEGGPATTRVVRTVVTHESVHDLRLGESVRWEQIGVTLGAWGWRLLASRNNEGSP